MSISILFCLAIIPLYFIISALVSPLRSVPGPFWARFSRLWKFYAISKGDFEKTNIELHKKYGPVVRIAPNEYSIDDPEAAREIYGLGGKFTKGPWYIASGSADPHAPASLFGDLDNKHHAGNRRTVASLYSMSNLVQMEPSINECTQILVDKFAEFAKEDQLVDMGHWLQCYAFDVVGQITLAKRFGFLDNGQDIGGIMSTIEGYLFYSTFVGVYSEWHRQVTFLQTKLSKTVKGMSALVKFAQDQVEARCKDTKVGTGDDHLTKLLNLHSDSSKGFTMADVVVTCGTNITAGSDTTSISLGSVVYHLCRSPTAMKTLKDEADCMEAMGKISNPVTFAEANQMPYLQAVIKEALRMHPATGLPLGRVVPEGGKFLAGHNFPAGSIVGINSWVAHANTCVFGDDAHIFRPERWLENKQKSLMMDRYFFSFGMGSRTCIGKNISLLEMSKLIPQLIRNFDISLEKPDDSWKTLNHWFVKPEQYLCKVRARVRSSI